MQSTLIIKVKKKIPSKNRCEYDQEITVAETEKATKSFKNNKSLDNDSLPAEFYNEILKTDPHKLYIKISKPTLEDIIAPSKQQL